MPNQLSDVLQTLELPVFGYTIYLCLSPSHWDKVKGDLEMTDEHWTAEGKACVRRLTCASLISIDPYDETTPISTLANTCAHEATHAFQNLCDTIGETSPSDEFEGYTIGHITGWLLETCFTAQSLKKELTQNDNAS